MIEKDWFVQHKFITIVVTLIIIWGSLLAFLWTEAASIRKHPCSICAEKAGSEVSCMVNNNFLNPDPTVFYGNGSIDVPQPRTIGLQNVNLT